MKNLIKLLSLIFIITFVTDQTQAQIVWRKDARNPVLTGGTGNVWNKHLFMPCVLYNADSSRYEMWFGATSGSPWRPYQIGFAVSKDGINWSMHPTPVLSPTTGTWDAFTVESPTVLRENGQYKMWYSSGLDVAPLYPAYIGYATSPDGIHWTKYAGNPVLEPATSGWEGAGGVYSCSILPATGGYHMWYGGYDEANATSSIGHAISSDGITWKRDTLHNPVLRNGGPGHWDYNQVLIPQVVPIGGTYYMWYGGFSADGSLHLVGLATSADSGITWTKYAGNPILLPTAGAWDGSYIECGTVLARGGSDTLDMWYAGGSDLWSIGHATSKMGQTIKDLCGPSFAAFVDRIEAAQDWQRGAIVDSFMVAPHGFPFVEDTIAQFIYRGSATSVNVPGDHNGWNPGLDAMMKLSTTDLWYAVRQFERDARIDYKFVVNGSTWILDPRNPSTTPGGYGPNSTLKMNEYVSPWAIQYDPTVPHGRSELRSVHSNIRGVNYSVQVYLPYGYDGSAGTYPAVYFQDGADYVNYGSAINVLDNLIAHSKIRPIIGVFVTPTNRNEEYAFSLRNQYRQFFVTELVPHIDSVYRTTRSPASRLVMGDSYGGNISALISYNSPDVFGLCGLQSGAFAPNNYEAYTLITNGPVKQIAYCSAWGTYSDVTYDMRLFRDAMIAKGYFFRWKERHEGHTWGQWSGTIDTILQTFFAPVTGVVAERTAMPTELKLEQNYPNPFNPSTTIGYALPRRSHVTLTVFNTLGQQVVTLVEGEKEAGYHEVQFDASALSSGVYIYRLRAGDFVQSRKLVALK